MPITTGIVNVTDGYVDDGPSTIGPFQQLSTVQFTVANQSVTAQVAKMTPNDKSLHWDEFEMTFPPGQTGFSGKVYGIRFRNAEPGKVAAVAVNGYFEDDPIPFTSPAPFNGTLTPGGGFTPSGLNFDTGNGDPASQSSDFLVANVVGSLTAPDDTGWDFYLGYDDTDSSYIAKFGIDPGTAIDPTPTINLALHDPYDVVPHFNPININITADASDSATSPLGGQINLLARDRNDGTVTTGSSINFQVTGDSGGTPEIQFDVSDALAGTSAFFILELDPAGDVQIGTGGAGGTFECATSGGGIQFTEAAGGPIVFLMEAAGGSIHMDSQYGKVIEAGDSGVASTLGFFAVAPVVQQATPVTLGDVIALLQAYGLSA